MRAVSLTGGPLVPEWGDRLDVPYPRAVYRVTLVRENRIQDWFTTTGISGREWRDIIALVERTLPRAGMVFQLGNAALTPDGTTAALNLRVVSHPGAVTIQHLVNALNDITPFAQVSAVERLPEVPGVSQGGAATLDANTTNAQVAAQAARDAEPSALERAGSAVGSAAASAGRATFGAVAGALVVGVVVLAFLLADKIPSANG